MKINLAFLAALATLAAGGLASGCSSTQPIHELRTHANESFERQEYKRTIAFDSEILRRQPDDVSATMQRGVAYDRLGNAADAQADYSRAVELTPDLPQPRLYRANLSLKQGQPEQARADVDALKGMELEKADRVAALVIEGGILQAKRDYWGAVRPYRQAVELGRGEVDAKVGVHYRSALNNASECYYRLGQFDAAVNLYDEYLASKSRTDEPVTEDDLYAMGVMTYLKGDFNRSKQCFAKVSAGKKKQAAKLLNDEAFFVAK